MSKLFTNWFSGSIKPVREGVYQRRMFGEGYNSSLSYSRWDGKYWCVLEYDKYAASTWRVISHYQDLEWRGLNRKS